MLSNAVLLLLFRLHVHVEAQFFIVFSCIEQARSYIGSGFLNMAVTTFQIIKSISVTPEELTL